MPRSPPADEAGGLYHALNRASLGAKILRKTDDFVAFENVLHEALQLYKVELYAYQIMGTPNHGHAVHLMLRPLVDGEMGRFCKWICGTHTMRYNAHDHMTGNGHLYQGRFKSFPIQDNEHFFVGCRYVERNALRAELVSRAEDCKDNPSLF